MRLAATLAGLTAATALVAGTIAPATAATQDHTDPAADTTVVFGSPDGDLQQAADVVSLRGRHGDGRLVITVGVDDFMLDSPDSRVQVATRIVTPTGREYTASVSRAFGSKFAQLVDNGQVASCDGFAARFFPSRDEYVVNIPRTCLRNPREVRFGAAVTATGGQLILDRTRRAIPSNEDQVSDDARRDGQLGEEIRLGTRALANN